MIRRLLHRLLLRRHPWRHIGFSELSEMYIAGFLRTLSIGLVGVFVPVYLLTHGFSITSVLAFYTLFYVFHVLFGVLAGYLVAYFGPKHVMRVSFVLQMVFSFLVVNLSVLPQPIVLLSLVSALGSALYFVPYHVDFSKIKHLEHSGKEIGFLAVMERLGGIIGPFLGGLLATIFVPEITFIAAGIFMLGAAIVLMLSPEPVVTRQKISFKGMVKNVSLRNRLAFAALAGENSISIALWPLYLAAVVFAVDIYLNVGLVTSVSVMVAVLVAVPLGTLLDKQKGRAMVVIGSIVNAVIHAIRPLAGNLPATLSVAAANEPNTLVYRLPMLKGFYDEADNHPGFRIAFITSQEAFNDTLRALIWLLLTLLSLYHSPRIVMAVGFLLGAVLSLAINLQKFRALR